MVTPTLMVDPVVPGDEPSIPIEGDVFLVAGPVRMSEATLQAMATPVMTARGTPFKRVMAELNGHLRTAFGLTPSAGTLPGDRSWWGEDGYGVLVVSGSGTAAVEMALANRFGPQDRVLVPTNGKFGERVAQLAARFTQVTHVRGDWGQSFALDALEALLGETPHAGLAICHNETSAGITQDAEALGAMACRHGLAYIIDGITSVGGLPVEAAAWGAEAVVVGAQKCTAGPSGVAGVAVSDVYLKAVRALRAAGDEPPTYSLDVLAAAKQAEGDQTPWTPAINLILGWREALRELAEEGLDARHARCRQLAEGVRSLFGSLGFQQYAAEGARSDTVTAICYPEGIDDGFRTRLAQVYSTQVIGGQDHVKGRIFRVGSMGLMSRAEMIEGCQRILACFRDMGVRLPAQVDVASHFA